MLASASLLHEAGYRELLYHQEVPCVKFSSLPIQILLLRDGIRVYVRPLIFDLRRVIIACPFKRCHVENSQSVSPRVPICTKNARGSRVITTYHQHLAPANSLAIMGTSWLARSAGDFYPSERR